MESEIDGLIKTILENPGSEKAILVLFLLCLGWVLKNRVPKFPNEFIPVTLIAVGSLLYPALLRSWTVLNVMMGFIIGAAAPGIHQSYIQRLYYREAKEVKPEEPTKNISSGDR